MFIKLVKGIVVICCMIYMIYVCIKDKKQFLNRVKDKHEQKKYIILAYLGGFLVFIVTGMWTVLELLGIKYIGISFSIVLSSVSIGVLFIDKADQIYIKDMQKRQDDSLIPEIKKQKKNCRTLYLWAIFFGVIAILHFIFLD